MGVSRRDDQNPVRQFYDLEARQYGRGVETMFARLQKDLFANLAPETGVAVDVGCGPGDLMRSVSGRRPHLRLVGIDLSDGMLLEAKSRAPDGKYVLIQASAENIPVSNNVSGFTTCFGTLLFADKRQALSELARVTKTGGWVMFDLPGLWNLATLASFRIHRRNQIEMPDIHRLSQYREQIENCGLHIESVISLGVSDHWKGLPLLWRFNFLERVMHRPMSSFGSLDLDFMLGRFPGFHHLAARWLFACRVRG